MHKDLRDFCIYLFQESNEVCCGSSLLYLVMRGGIENGNEVGLAFFHFLSLQSHDALASGRAEVNLPIDPGQLSILGLAKTY